MNFFPEPPDHSDADDVEEHPQPVWTGPPEDVLPGVVPVELLLGRSTGTVVLLTGMRAFPSGLQMNLAVRVRGRVARRDLDSEVFDGPYAHDMDSTWQARRLKWGFEFSDGRRATNVDPSPQPPVHDQAGAHHWDWTWVPDRPILSGGGGGGGSRSVDRDYWLWPLPPAGRLRLVCQWLDQDIELTAQELDAEPFLQAAQRAQPVWPPA